MHKLERIFYGYDMFGISVIYPVDDGCHGGGLATSRGTGYQHQAAFVGGQFFDGFRHSQLLKGHDFGGNNAEYSPDTPMLVEKVAAKASHSLEFIRLIKVAVLFECFLLPLGQQFVEDGPCRFRRQHRCIEPHQISTHPQ